MKKFITTKLHAVSVSVQEHSTFNVENVEKVINEKTEEGNNAKSLTGVVVGGIVGLQSASATSSLSSSVTAAATAVTVMTLNSPTSKQKNSGISNSNINGIMMTGEVPLAASPHLVQHQQQQHGGAVITISKPKPSTTTTAGPGSSSSTAGQVKMCGYLKKKRNKMGGWRKMYFILQNQLLLSYSSKDDYEKKLAPFKDIINLVPGTVIIPTTGPRFTIETNSKVLYTFRCDDHKSCSEWITALLDSLKGDGSGGDKKFSHHALHGGRNGSSSNLQHHLTRRSLSSLSSSSSSTSSTASCYATDDPSKMAITSIRRLQQSNLLHPQQHHQQKQTSLSAPNLFYGFGSNGTGGGAGATASAIIATSKSSNVKMGKLVQLPIAGGTARLLERGGANGQKMYKILTINEDDADDDADGENDEKPTVATTSTTATATATARSIGNGIAGRGDPGIKVTTTAAPPSTSSSSTPSPGAVTEEKEKNAAVHVKSRSATVNSLKAAKPSGTKGERHRADELLNSNFRLHTNLGKMHQSSEVCRINSMFGGKKLASSSSSSGKRLNNHGVNSKTANSASNLAASTGDLRSNKIVGANGNNNHSSSSHNVIYNNLRGTRGGSATDLRRKPPPDLLLHSSGAASTASTMEPKPLKDINHNNLAKWSAESITIELTSNGYNMLSGTTGIKSIGSTDTLYRKLNANGGGGRSRSNSHSSHLQQSSSSSSTPLPAPQPSSSSQNRGFSSKIDLIRTLSSASKRNDYEEIDARNGTMEGATSMMEPIYAVVDLSVKKARRMNHRREHDSLGTVDDGTETEEEHSIKVDMVRDKETGRLKEKSKSANVLPLGGIFGGGSNDYEELNELVMESFVNFGEDQDDSNDGENIYEPINIPEGPLSSSSTSLPAAQPTTSSSQMNNLWRNLKKMNINHLMKRSVQDQSQQQQQQQSPQQLDQRPDEDPITKVSSFSEFSKKFGYHRRSIKNKMRGLYDRGQSAEAPPPKITQSEEKLRKSSDGTRQLMFSTFGRNKKSRKSLSFDDFIPRKKHHHHLNGVGVICKSDKANEKLHKELKRQLSKRSDSSSGSSSFVDSKNGIEL